MEWKIDDRYPIWSQLSEQLAAFITGGQFEAGQRLPSVREFAADAGVNPNTMQRAMAELESLGLVVTNRTAGRAVTEDRDRIDQIRRTQVKKEVDIFLERMEALGFTRDEIMGVLREALTEEEDG